MEAIIIMIFMSQEEEFVVQNNRQANHYQERGSVGGRGQGQGRGHGQGHGRDSQQQGWGDQELKRYTQHNAKYLW